MMMSKRSVKANLRFVNIIQDDKRDYFEIIERVVIVKQGVRKEIETHTIKFFSLGDLNEYLEGGK